MAAIPLEERVAALEVEVARLKAKVEGESSTTIKPWWKEIWGTFANDPMFLDAMRYGREYRESLRPRPTKRRKK
jgi:hypothetical protein